MNRWLADEAATIALGQALARVLGPRSGGLVVTLAGELGAGKTALVRAIIQKLGHDGAVVSPSYTLVEPYEIGGRMVRHLDLYRLGDPEELEFVGVRDFDPRDELIFIEWADRGRGYLPPTDLKIKIVYDADGRCASLDACSAAGQAVLSACVAAAAEHGR